MLATLTFLILLAISLLVVRVGTVALTMTGVSEDVASFQALSAFTGTGFTTSETEMLVNQPARRRILRDLMVLGNMGFVSMLASGLGSWNSLQDPSTRLPQLSLIVIGVSILLLTSTSNRIRRWMKGPIAWSLAYMTDLEIQDYAAMLRLEGGYSVAEIKVEAPSQLIQRTLAELRLSDEGIWVLGIHRREGGYLGVPGPLTKILKDDILLVYGQEATTTALADKIYREARAAELGSLPPTLVEPGPENPAPEKESDQEPAGT